MLNAVLSITLQSVHAPKVTQVIRLIIANQNHQKLNPLKPTHAILLLAAQTPNATTEYAPVYQNTKETLTEVADPSVS